MLTLTIVMKNSGTVMDIMVKPEQRIREVLMVLAENGKILFDHLSEAAYTRSWRLGKFVNNQLTFKQAQVYSGDIIYVEVEKL